MKTRILIQRTCPANLIVNGDSRPVHGPKAGQTFIGTYRPENDSANHPDSWGCVELDTQEGTWSFPADAVLVIPLPRLMVVQAGNSLAEVARPDAVAGLPHVTDLDQKESKATVERLKAQGTLQTGYYDLLLYDPNGKEIDGSTEIA